MSRRPPHILDPLRTAVTALPAVLAAQVLGCAELRTTDPPRTATEQFLVNVASERAVEQMNLSALQDRLVYVSTEYVFGNPSVAEASSTLIAAEPTPDQSYLLGEVRAKLLRDGARLSQKRDEAECIVEVRVQSLGIDRIDYIFGFPGIGLPDSDVSGVPVIIPEIALLENLKQKGYSAVAVVAYWRDTGSLITSTPMLIGRTSREDYWIFGVGPNTTGDIPPVIE